MMKHCRKCDRWSTCWAEGQCRKVTEMGQYKQLDGLLYTSVVALLVIAIIVMLVLFLSSRPAGASHGPTGYVISDCCVGVNRASGTSYRTVALAFSPPVRPVFERGAEPVSYLLQWPHLEPTADQYIRAARQRLSVLLAVDASGSVVRSSAQLAIDRQHMIKAAAMACFFGGLMLVISFWPYRNDSRK